MAQLASSGATRIETTFYRFNPLFDGPAGQFISAGHAIRGYTAVP